MIWWFTYDFPFLFALFSICQSAHQFFSAPSFVESHFLHTLMVVVVATFASVWRRKGSLSSDVICLVKITYDVANLYLIEFSRDVFGFIFILDRIFFARCTLSKIDGSSWAWILICWMQIQFPNVGINDIFSIDDGINIFASLEFKPIIVIASRDKDVFQ